MTHKNRFLNLSFERNQTDRQRPLQQLPLPGVREISHDSPEALIYFGSAWTRAQGRVVRR
jgi:hypothetical protein